MRERGAEAQGANENERGREFERKRERLKPSVFAKRVNKRREGDKRVMMRRTWGGIRRDATERSRCFLYQSELPGWGIMVATVATVGQLWPIRQHRVLVGNPTLYETMLFFSLLFRNT